MKDLSGINLAMQTPFHDDGSIDFVLYESLLDRYVEAGVHGIVLGAGTGQYVNLSEDECNTCMKWASSASTGAAT